MICSYCKRFFHIFPSIYAVLLSVVRETWLPQLFPSEGTASFLVSGSEGAESERDRGRGVNFQREVVTEHFYGTYKQLHQSVSPHEELGKLRAEGMDVPPNLSVLQNGSEASDSETSYLPKGLIKPSNEQGLSMDDQVFSDSLTCQVDPWVESESLWKKMLLC